MRQGRSSKNNGLFKAAALLLLLLGAQIMSAQHWKPVLQDSIGDEVKLTHLYNAYHCLYNDTVNNVFLAGGRIIIVDSNENPVNSHSVLRLNQTTQMWDTIDKRNDVPHPGYIRDMTWYKGRYYLTGTFSEIGSAKGGNWAYYQGGRWKNLNPRPDGGGAVFMIDSDTLYMGGSFVFTDQVYSPGFVKFDGMNYYPAKPALDTSPNTSTKPWGGDIVRFRDMIVVAGRMFESVPANIINSLVVFKDGKKQIPEGYEMSIYSKAVSLAVYQDALYIGGTFRKSDGVSFANYIVMWDSENWHELGNGCDGEVHQMIEYHGDLIVTGIFNHCDGVYSPYIIKWNGRQWCSFTNDSLNNRINDVEVFDDTLYIAGPFIFSNGDTIRHVAKWAGGDSVMECGPVHYIGVQQPEGQSEIKLEVRPNPTEGMLQVYSGSNMTRLELRNLQGQRLYEKRLNSVQDYTLDLSGLSPSIYVLSVVTEEGTTVRKVVKR